MQLMGASEVQRLSGSKRTNVNSRSNYTSLLPCTSNFAFGLLISLGTADVKYDLQHARLVGL